MEGVDARRSSLPLRANQRNSGASREDVQHSNSEGSNDKLALQPAGVPASVFPLAPVDPNSSKELLPDIPELQEPLVQTSSRMPSPRSMVTISSLGSSDEESIFDENDNLETLVLSVLGPDLVTAARMIEYLHGLFPGGFVMHPSGTNTYSSNSPSSIGNLGPGTAPSITGSKSTSDAQGGPHRSGGRDGRNPRKPLTIASMPSAMPEKPRYACWFHKWRPEKYRDQSAEGSTGDFYRSCMRPGYDSISHARIHLQRKHKHVQCPRCWAMFPNRAACDEHVSDGLEDDRKKCTKVAEGREGIDETTWQQLDRECKGKDYGRLNNVGKWKAIWKVLFPNEVIPEHPCGSPYAQAQQPLQRRTFFY
ncbi:hypothetical protein BDZ45DRAFT_808982 [Acephala macrosclerotiorum]|nr:hypothetical protein BDZ45DRAFT_808982 [Acephala macrosclerotiorum]